MRNKEVNLTHDEIKVIFEVLFDLMDKSKDKWYSRDISSHEEKVFDKLLLPLSKDTEYIKHAIERSDGLFFSDEVEDYDARAKRHDEDRDIWKSDCF